MPKTGNPQLEHGHTRIANELLEALVGHPFGGGELKVILAIIRLTYGWQRRSSPLKQTTLARLTRLDRRQIQRVLTALRQQGVLFRDRTTRPFTYQLNKAYQGWRDWPADDLPDNVVRFMKAANEGSHAGCELSSEGDTFAAAAPDTCVRSVKEIKKEIKERDLDPAVQNLLARFSQLLRRPLTEEEQRLVCHLQELSPTQAQQLLQQVADRCLSAPDALLRAAKQSEASGAQAGQATQPEGGVDVHESVDAHG